MRQYARARLGGFQSLFGAGFAWYAENMEVGFVLRPRKVQISRQRLWQAFLKQNHPVFFRVSRSFMFENIGMFSYLDTSLR